MEDFLRSWVEALLITGSWSQDLAGRLGIKGASQVWDERPGWYLWLDQTPGPHGLFLASSQEEDGVVWGAFAVKLYPEPGSPELAGFSPQERSLVRGPAFDHTHAPTFEGAAEMAPGLFALGGLEVTAPREGGWAMFTLAAQDRLATREDGGPVVRNLRAWRMALPLLRVLAGLHAFHAHQVPARVRLTREPGVQQLAGAGGVSLEPSPEDGLHLLHLLFCPDPSQPPPQALALWPGGGLEATPPLMDQSFACGHLHEPGPEVDDLPALWPPWWELAGAEVTSHLACTCGGDH